MDSDHKTGNILYRHICTYCFNTILSHFHIGNRNAGEKRVKCHKAQVLRPGGSSLWAPLPYFQLALVSLLSPTIQARPLTVSTADVNIVCDASDNLTDSTGSLLHDSCTTTECSYRLHVSTANVNAVCDSDNLTDIIGILPHEPCTATDCSYKLHVSTANGNAVCDQASNLTDSTGKRLAGSATGSSQENYFTDFATTACGSSVSRHFTD